jgi:hypothetical protein
MGKKKNAAIEAEWVEFRNSVYETKSKSQDDFEKYINLIASGGLAITIAFFDKIVNIKESICIALMVSGWILLALTLLINLISHYLSIDYSEKTIGEINRKEYDEVFINVEKRNKKIKNLNIMSIVTLISGITTIITFVTLNLLIMSNDKPKPQERPSHPKPLTEERGRQTNNPPQNKPNSTPKK